MIKKETFKKVIDYLKAKSAVTATLDECLRDQVVFADGMWPIDNADCLLVEILEEVMGIPVGKYGSTLSWWIYDMDFGTRFHVGDINIQDVQTPDNNPCPLGDTPDIQSIDNLYDFLMWEARCKEEEENGKERHLENHDEL